MLCTYLGLQDFYPVLALQNHLRRLQKAGFGEDICLILQHRPVITLGNRGRFDHLRLPVHLLTKIGFQIAKTNRGGLVTYHGPGQLVAYFITNLYKRHLSIPEFVSKLEEIMIKTLGEFGIEGHRSSIGTGVWIKDKKICSVGINVSKGITIHGASLNANNDLRPFKFFRPCGLDINVTSIARELGKEIDFDQAVKVLIKYVKKGFL